MTGLLGRWASSVVRFTRCVWNLFTVRSQVNCLISLSLDFFMHIGIMGFPRDAGSIPGLGRSPEGMHGNPLQYSCLESPMDRGAWQSTGSQRVGYNWSNCCLVVSNSLWPHGLQHSRLSCPSPTPGACSNSCPSGRGCHPLLPLLPSVIPSIRVFSNESVLHIRWPKYWSFSFSISPSNAYSGLISFRIRTIITTLQGKWKM